MSIFSETLVELRRGAGFPTAYRFYHSNGGRPAIGLSYRKYLLVEQGRSFPKFERVRKLMFPLRLLPSGPDCKRLVRAWIRTMVGDEAFFDVMAPAFNEDDAAIGLPPIYKALKQGFSGVKYYLSPDQFRAILTTRYSYLVHLALSSDRGAWSVQELSESLNIPRSEMQTAFNALISAKLLKKSGEKRYCCPLWSKMVEFPHMNTVEQSLRAKMERYNEELLAASLGRWEKGCVIRADVENLRNFFPLMRVNVSAARSYAIAEKTAHSALFFIQSRVVKLREF